MHTEKLFSYETLQYEPAQLAIKVDRLVVKQRKNHATLPKTQVIS